MKKLILVGTTAVAATLFGSTALAANYPHSIDNCREAISQQMGVERDAVRLKVKNIRTRASGQTVKFHAYSNIDKQAERVKVTCKVQPNQQVLALNFTDSRYPIAAVNQAKTTPAGGK